MTSYNRMLGHEDRRGWGGGVLSKHRKTEMSSKVGVKSGRGEKRNVEKCIENRRCTTWSSLLRLDWCLGRPGSTSRCNVKRLSQEAGGRLELTCDSPRGPQTLQLLWSPQSRLFCVHFGTTLQQLKMHILLKKTSKIIGVQLTNRTL